jgi:Fe-S cluster assembly scaffold protein SufB
LDQLFYLESRGIPQIEALEMIVRGFTEEVVSLFPGEKIHSRIDEALTQKHMDPSQIAVLQLPTKEGA